MAEKKDWKTDMFQKTKDIETLQANAKRSNTLQSEASQRAEQYLTERKELEAEVMDLGAQVCRYMIILDSLQFATHLLTSILLISSR